MQDACIYRAGVTFWGAGASKSQPVELYAKPASTLLNNAATDNPFLDRIHVKAGTYGTGVRVERIEDLIGPQRGKWSGLTFAQHLNQWITLRNALAHNSIRQLITKAKDPNKWTDPQIGDPYKSIQANGSQVRYRLWESDALGDSEVPEPHRLVGATVQAWSARSCLAFIIQTVDWLIVEVAHSHGRGWDPTPFRLPPSWFERDLPRTFRGAKPDDYAHWSLWEGPELYRRA
jgi:hypothetical protein